MSLSHRNGPGPFGRGSWWEGFRCGSGPGLVRVFVPGGSRPTAPRARRRRHLHGYRGRCGQGCAMGAQAAGRGSGPPLGHGRRGRHCPPPVKTRLSTPSGIPTAARAGSVSGADGPWTKRTATGAEPRTRSHCAPSAPSNPPSAAGSVDVPGLGRGRGPRWSGRPGVPSVPCSRARRRRSGGAGAHRRSVPCPRARRLRQRTRKHQPPRPPSRPPSPRRAHTTARSPARATTRYSSRPPDRGPAPVRRTRGGHVTARRATTIQATTAERGTATQDIPPAGTGREPHYQSRPSRGRLPARSVRPILPTAGVRPGRAPMLDTGRGARRH